MALAEPIWIFFVMNIAIQRKLHSTSTRSYHQKTVIYHHLLLRIFRLPEICAGCEGIKISKMLGNLRNLFPRFPRVVTAGPEIFGQKIMKK